METIMIKSKQERFRNYNLRQKSLDAWMVTLMVPISDLTRSEDAIQIFQSSDISNNSDGSDISDAVSFQIKWLRMWIKSISFNYNFGSRCV